MNHRQHATLEGHPTLDPFRHQFVGIRFGFLEIAVFRAFLHGAQRTHATVGFVGAPLEQLDLAWSFLGAREQAAQHHAIRTGSDRFGDVAGVTDAAIGDYRHAAAFQRLYHIGDGRNLWHTDAGDNAGGANRARADADLDRVGAVVNQRQSRRCGGDIAADHLHLREVVLDPLHPAQHTLGMAVRGIHHNHVHTRFSQQGDALLGALAHAHRSANPQLALAVLACQRMLGGFLNVLDGNQATQLEIIVDHQHPLQTVFMHQRHGFIAAGAFLDRDQAVSRRHDISDRLIKVDLEAQVAVGDDADHMAIIHHRQAGNLVLAGQCQDIPDCHLRGNGDWILDHAALEALHAGHLRGLRGGGHVLVNDAEPPFLRQSNRQARFGDGIHRRRNQGNIEGDFSG